ncbi:MAG: hypothetical protein ABW019_05830 [Chitinophagaceae bacterium]
MKQGIVSIVFLFFSGLAIAQDGIRTAAYSTGVYIFCGTELPRRFSYIVERRGAADTGWTVLAELKTPKSEAECQGRLMSIPEVMLVNTQIDTARVKWVWNRVAAATAVDSLYAFAADPRYQFVAGVGWFDEGVPAGAYQYRVSKKDRDNRLSPAGEQRISFPSVSYAGSLRTVRFKPDDRGVIIHYAVSDTLHTAGVKLWRSKQHEQSFSEVKATPFFTKVNNQWVAEIVDSSVAKGMAYQYVAVPVDPLGNPGRTSDTVTIYAMARPAEIGLVQDFDVKPSEEKGGMELSWKIKSAVALTSIEIYRSRSGYDSTYEKIASVSPAQTSYFDDRNLLPATGYFYYIVANGGYGRSFPSARVPGILKGNNANIIPPQNVTVVRRGNIATLSFTKVEPDTRGYYIYRANSYTGPLQQLSRMVLSSDSLVQYMDTLPMTGSPEVYTYAVADINTSYAVSAPGDRVSVRTPGRIPIPDGVAAMQQGDNVWVTWKDQARQGLVVAYQLYRSEAADAGAAAGSETLIATLPPERNSFLDTTVNEGKRYRYSVRCRGLEQGDEGGMSQWASIYLPDVLPLAPARVVAIAAENKIVLKWESPEDASVTKINIYRAKEGEAAQKIASLPLTAKTYEDATAQKGVMYYYFLAAENGRGKESRVTEPVSAKVR